MPPSGGGEEPPPRKPRQSTSMAMVTVDMVYGLHPEHTSGGCVVQRSFEGSLRDAGVSSIRVHVASTPSSAERVFQRLIRREEEGRAFSKVLIIDGIAIFYLRDKLRALKNNPARLLVGFIHFPFSEPFYRKEHWLKTALPERLLIGPDAGALLREEETRLFGLLDKVVAVGAPCRSIITGKHGIPDNAIIFLEPTFPALPPPSFSTSIWTSISVPLKAFLSGSVGGEATVPGNGRGGLSPVSEYDVKVERPSNTSSAVVATGRDDGLARPRSPPLKFVSVGTLCPRKGQLELVAAFVAACSAHSEKLSGSTLTLIGGDGGDPVYAAAVRNTAAASLASVEVRVLGPMPHDQTLESLADSDAFLMNSSFESWAMAPVEAALRGVPVLTTRVGALWESLPHGSTVWVGRQQGAEDGDRDEDDAPASATDWEQALLRFARDERRLRAEARRAVLDLRRRFGRTAEESEARAVRELLKATRDGASAETLLALWPNNTQGGSVRLGRVTDMTDMTTELEPSWHAAQTPDTPIDGGAANSSGIWRDSAVTMNKEMDDDELERERVRRAMIVHALFSVCAACLAVCGSGGGTMGGVASLVASQLLLLVILAPPPTPANVVTVIRSFIPAAVVGLRAGSDFTRVTTGDASIFGVVFVILDILDGALARGSKGGPTRIGAALDVESDSMAMLFLSLAASRKAWSGGVVAGILRYLFVLATGARELPPSPIGPAGRWVAKFAALFSVIALALSIGGIGGDGNSVIDAGEGGGGWSVGGGETSSSPLLCFAGVAVLCASFSVDFYQIWFVLPRERKSASEVEAEAGPTAAATAVVGKRSL